MASMDIHKWDIGLARAPQSRVLMLNGDALDPGETNFRLTAEQAFDIGIALLASTVPTNSHVHLKKIEVLLRRSSKLIVELIRFNNESVICPGRGQFGIDIMELTHCENCKILQACIDENEKLQIFLMTGGNNSRDI
jgi:hypothetical protein